MSETVAGYSFRPPDLRADARPAGISAFMRIRNGAAFLEPVIRSHIDHFDEIVAVHNQCTDATADILARLQAEFGPRLQVFHYVDRVHPPGSEDHARTPADSPASLVNYSNFALARTRFRTVTKLDDDHLALDADLSDTVRGLRAAGGAGDVLHAFSGLNLWRGPAGGGPLSLVATEPVSGSGDIGFFDVRADRVFTHDRRFERTPRAGLKRRFVGLLYWHLKYLKPGAGFANYELADNPDSRFARKKRTIDNSGALTDMDALAGQLAAGRRWPALTGKQRFVAGRDRAIAARFAGQDVETAVRQTVRDDLLAFL